MFPREITGSILAYNMVFYQEKPELETHELLTIKWQSQPQPSFNRNFDLLIQDLKLRKEEGYACYIFSDNDKQLVRLAAILKDLKADIHVQMLTSTCWVEPW